MPVQPQSWMFPTIRMKVHIVSIKDENKTGIY